MPGNGRTAAATTSAAVAFGWSEEGDFSSVRARRLRIGITRSAGGWKGEELEQCVALRQEPEQCFVLRVEALWKTFFWDATWTLTTVDPLERMLGVGIVK